MLTTAIARHAAQDLLTTGIAKKVNLYKVYIFPTYLIISKREREKNKDREKERERERDRKRDKRERKREERERNKKRANANIMVGCKGKGFSSCLVLQDL